MELPTSNRKKLLTFDWLVLSQKSTLFPFFRRSYLGNRLTYIAENLRRFFFKHYLQVCQISSKSEGGLANLAKNWLIWHGMTLMGRVPALIQPVDTRVIYLVVTNLRRCRFSFSSRKRLAPVGILRPRFIFGFRQSLLKVRRAISWHRVNT